MKIKIHDNKHVGFYSDNKAVFSYLFKKHIQSQVPTYFFFFYRVLNSNLLKYTLSYERFNEIYNA